MTYVRSVLVYESRSPFLQGRCEFHVLFVSFEKRLDAWSERLVICGADRLSGSNASGGDGARTSQPSDCGDALLVECLDFAHVAVCGSDVRFHLLKKGFELGRSHVLVGGQGVWNDA